MKLRRATAVAIVLLGVGLGATACRQQAETSSPPAGTGSSTAPLPRELQDIQTTLDAIDSEMAGDGPG